MLDVYGELIRNNQKFKDAPNPMSMLKKARSGGEPPKKSFIAKKMNLQKEKLIFKFLKS